MASGDSEGGFSSGVEPRSAEAMARRRSSDLATPRERISSGSTRSSTTLIWVLVTSLASRPARLSARRTVPRASSFASALRRSISAATNSKTGDTIAPLPPCLCSEHRSRALRFPYGYPRAPGGGPVSQQHPLFDLAADPRTRRASDFRALAAGLKGAELAAAFEQEVAAAAAGAEGGRKHFVAYNRRLAAERRPARDGEHLALALVEHRRRSGQGITLPDGKGSLDPIAAHVTLPAGRADLLGLGPDDRLTLAQIRYLAPGASRAGTGDTPLEAALEALARAAAASACRAALAGEIVEACGRSVGAAPPLVAVLGSPRYWELCRRREAQKGAAWIHELERLARELEEASGISLLFLACRLEGDPGWSYPEGAPVLDAAPRLAQAWEVSAGRVRPKAPPRPKPGLPVEVRVEADLARPIRGYAASEKYAAGDRISHPKLGLGVVQGQAGAGKISVLFDDRKVVLVHGRSAPALPSPSVPVA